MARSERHQQLCSTSSFLLWSKHPSTQSSLRAPATRQASPSAIWVTVGSHLRANRPTDQTCHAEVAYGAGFVSTLGVLATALTWMAPALAQLVNIAVTPIVIYSTMRLVGFGRPPSTAEPTCHGLDD